MNIKNQISSKIQVFQIWDPIGKYHARINIHTWMKHSDQLCEIENAKIREWIKLRERECETDNYISSLLSKNVLTE